MEIIKKEVKEEVVEKRNFETFKSIKEKYNKRPKKVFLWNGIKEGSFGLFFGPAKSGKTILCENLAANIATGTDSFMGYDLSGKPQKILFVGLEEFWEDRIDRNIKQFANFNDKQKELIDQNYLYQTIDFTRKIVEDKDWTNLTETIIESEAKVVFIDSITRMNHGKLEDSKTAEEIMQRLRDICYSLRITLICIHHSPKLNGKGIFMDSMKGSSTFSAESDFAIGVNRTQKNNRYFKNIFFRYASDSDDMAKEFEITDNVVTDFLKESEEDEVLARSDRRKAIDKEQKVINYFSENSDTTFSKNELVNYLKNQLGVKDRMAENYLKNAIDNNLVVSPKRGFYKYNLKQ
jgi:KaiC/GvpD/RAD55 family RecA-like ATPase